MMMRRGLLALAVSSLAGVVAAGPLAVSDSMRACAQEHDDGRRLACYDQEMARTEKSYGLSSSQKRKLDPPPKAAAEPEGTAEPGAAAEAKGAPEAKAARVDAPPPVISSKVQTVVLRRDGRNVITLENGQVWVQGEAFESTEIKTGDPVTIKPGMLGSLYMYLPKLRTRVTRER
jgi:hypothetical protein